MNTTLMLKKYIWPNITYFCSPLTTLACGRYKRSEIREVSLKKVLESSLFSENPKLIVDFPISHAFEKNES